MRFDTSIARALCVALPAAVLTACSGGGLANSPSTAIAGATVQNLGFARNVNWISPQAQLEAKSTGLLFVADAANNDIAIFSKNDPTTPIGTITNGIADPEEIAVDASANLYVTNLTNHNVTVYAPPYTAPPVVTYSTGLTYPFSVTVGTNGRVYVSDNPGNTSGQIQEYPAHALNPSLTVPINGYAEGLALDAANRLYVAFNPNGGNARVYRFGPDSKKGADLGLPLQFVSGVTLDTSGNLLVEDQIPATVDVFPPGAKKPSAIINNGGKGFGDPVSIAFGTSESRLYIGDGMNDVVDIVAYPSGKTIGQISGFGRVHGVAVTPPAPK